MREDTGSNDIEGAEAHEKLRAERDDPPEETGERFCCTDHMCPCLGWKSPPFGRRRAPRR